MTNKFNGKFHKAVTKVLSKNSSTEFFRFFKIKKDKTGAVVFKPRNQPVQVKTSTLSYKTKLIIKLNK